MVSAEPHGLTSFPSRSGRSCATSYAPIGSRDGVFLSQTSHNLLYVRCTPVEFLLQVSHRLRFVKRMKHFELLVGALGNLRNGVVTICRKR